MPKKEYVSRTITNVGDTESCPVCKKSDDHLSTVTKHDNRTTYKKIDIESDEGQKIAEKERIKEIPYIKDCKTYKDGLEERTRCRTITGFEEDDWSDFNKLVPEEEMQKLEEKKEQVDAEAKNKPKPKVDEESGIEEPEEPEEPEEE